MNKYAVHFNVGGTESQIQVQADRFTINENLLRFYVNVEGQEDDEVIVCFPTKIIIYVIKEEKK